MISRPSADIQPPHCYRWRLSPGTGHSHSTCQVLSDVSDAPSVHSRQYGGIQRRTPSNSQEALFSLVRDHLHNSSAAGGDFQCWPLSRAATEATKQLVLSSTNPSMLPWMVQESWMHCPVWYPTRLSGFISSDLVFAGKDKNHNLSSHESFPLTQALSATSTELAPWSSSMPHK